METKICKKCGIEKDINEFYKDKKYKDNHINICKECKKKYYLENKEKILCNIHNYYKKNNEHIKEYKKQYRKENKDKIKIEKRKYYQKNKDFINKKTLNYYYNNINKLKEKHKRYLESNQYKIKIYKKEYKIHNKEKINEYNRNKYANDYIYRLKIFIRNSLNRYIKEEKRNKHIEEIIGCDFIFLNKYLLQTFKNNYGYDWNNIEKAHIDHIVPLSSAKNKNDMMKLNYYTNLQLLKAEDNLHKSNKLNWKL